MDQDNGTHNDRVAQLHRALEAQVAELVSGEDWARMLATAAKFHAYSANNVMLILSQRPDATRVAGYQAWRSVGRQVRKGERGISILAPVLVRAKKRQEDNDTIGETRDDGTETVVGFRVAHVFDIAQTDGDPLPEVDRPALLDGEAPTGLWEDLASQVEGEGFTLERGDCGGANGITTWGTRTVRVRDDVSDAQAAKTLCHELAHVLLHERDFGTCRGRKEVEAESVAYIVCQAAGLVTDSYSLPYVAAWSGGDTAEVRKTAARVLMAARAILDAIPQAPEALAA
jgi:antirestriction protein ArdC